MFNRLAARRPPTITNLSPRTRRTAIGTAAVIPALLIGALASTHFGTPHDSGLVARAPAPREPSPRGLGTHPKGRDPRCAMTR